MMAEEVDHHLHRVVKEVPCFSAVDETHELLISATDPHDEAREHKDLEVTHAKQWVHLVL